MSVESLLNLELSNLEKYIKLFKDYLKEIKNFSPHTITAYQQDLQQYLAFCQKNNIFKWSERKTLRLFLKSFFEKKYSSTSIYRYRCSLGSFFNFLLKQNLINHSPAKQLGKFKKNNKLPQWLSQKKVHKVIDQLEEENKKSFNYLLLRDTLIYNLFYGLGLRISELALLKINDINLKNQVVCVLGKGNHHQVVPLTPRLVDKIRDYLLEREIFIATSKKLNHDYLFCNYLAEKITIRGIRYSFQQRLLKNKQEIIHPHALRHSIATHLLEKGAGIKEVQKVLRHRSIASTQIYTHLSPQVLKKNYSKYHPFSNVSVNLTNKNK